MAQGEAGTEKKDGGTAAVARRDGGSLETENGKTTIADGVVTKVASIAAREVAGVHELGGGTARAVGTMSQRVGFGDQRGQGVSVEVGEREAAVDLVVVIEYGESVPRVAEAIREQVTKRIEGITGLKVTEVNIDVTDLYFPGEDTPDEPPRVA